MKMLNKINDGIASLETGLLIVIVLLMVSFAFLQVVLRNIFDHGLLWGDIFLRHLVLWVGFIGASLATKERKHITIDLFTRLLKGRAQALAQMVIDLFSAFVAGLLVQASWAFVMEEKAYETMLFGKIPAWYFQIIIPIGFGLILLRFLIGALQKLTEAVHPKSGDDA